MKRILIVTLALIVVFSFSANRANAADYATWLFVKHVIAFEHLDNHHNLTTGSVDRVAVKDPAYRPGKKMFKEVTSEASAQQARPGNRVFKPIASTANGAYALPGMRRYKEVR